MAKVSDDGTLGGLSRMDRIRITVKTIGAAAFTVAYSICHEIIGWMPYFKQHATPTTCIIVGGIAGAVALIYETQFLKKAISPEQIPSQFPPPPVQPFPPPPVQAFPPPPQQ